MTQHQLDRAVARRTGESARTIAARGFSLLELTPRNRPSQGSTVPAALDHENAIRKPARHVRTP